MADKERMPRVKRYRRFFVSGALTFLALLLSSPARSEDAVVGVNVVNPMPAKAANQDALLAQLKAARVHIIRCGISPDTKGIDFARRAAAQGIRIQLIVSPAYPPDAPSRPYQPTVFPSMWGGHPLSSADPTLSKAAFQSLFNQLDSNGLLLAGIELGNEINWAAFNPEFPLPGEGKILSLSDLSHDPEGKKIAAGFLQYLKILAALREVRDHSRLNHNTPLILGGLVSAPDGESCITTKKKTWSACRQPSLFFARTAWTRSWTLMAFTPILQGIIPAIPQPS